MALGDNLVSKELPHQSWRTYDRFDKTYAVEEVIRLVRYKSDDRGLILAKGIENASFRGYDNRKNRTMFDGHMVYLSSSRLRTFALSGTACVDCGIVGSYFVKERDWIRGSHKGKHNQFEYFHLNLYGFSSAGKEVLMTKDHIIPKSKGGRNHISNYQTMCCHCNNRKGDTYEATV